MPYPSCPVVQKAGDTRDERKKGMDPFPLSRFQKKIEEETLGKTSIR